MGFIAFDIIMQIFAPMKYIFVYEARQKAVSVVTSISILRSNHNKCIGFSSTWVDSVGRGDDT